MNTGPLEEWVRPAVGALVLLGAAVFFVYLIVRDYRPADPSGFMSANDRSAMRRGPLPRLLEPTAAATVPVNAPDHQPGPCETIGAEFTEVRAALAQPQGHEESAYLKRRFQELRSRAHASNCAVVPAG